MSSWTTKSHLNLNIEAMQKLPHLEPGVSEERSVGFLNGTSGQEGRQEINLTPIVTYGVDSVRGGPTFHPAIEVADEYGRPVVIGEKTFGTIENTSSNHRFPNPAQDAACRAIKDMVALNQKNPSSPFKLNQKPHIEADQAGTGFDYEIRNESTQSNNDSDEYFHPEMGIY